MFLISQLATFCILKLFSVVVYTQFKVLRPTIEQNIDSLNLNIIKNCLCINVSFDWPQESQGDYQ